MRAVRRCVVRLAARTAERAAAAGGRRRKRLGAGCGCGPRGPTPSADLAAVAAARRPVRLPGDAEWPAQLDDLGDARPIGLWVRGRPNLRMWALRSVAVVGARACTEYGAHMAATLGAGLAERGWVVVSGAAYGVDGAAHRGALAAGGATVAVLACGVDVAYPRGHTELIGRIAEQGLVVGELPPGDHPTPSRFILRNRVIAALTRGTVVVEAALPQRLSGHRPARAAAGASRWGCRARSPAGSPPACTNCCAARPRWSPTPPRSSSWSATWESWRRSGGGRCCPRTCWTRRAARVLDALPARGTADAGRDRPGCRHHRGRRASRRLYELRSLGFVERHGDGWQLTRAGDPRLARRGGT